MGRDASLGKTTGTLAAAAAGVLLFLPVAGLDPFLLDVVTTGFLFAVFAGSWDIVGGVAGQVSLGHALFFGIATYACAVLTTLSGWPFPAAALAAVLLSALAGAGVGALAAPLQGPFVAVLTLALGEAAHELALGNVFLAGPGGYAWGGEGGIPVAVPWGPGSPLRGYYAALGFLAAAVWAMVRIRSSRVGLLLRALEGSELTARASGVDVERHKRRAFAIAAALAGAAGVAYAAQIGRATANDLSLELSFQAATFAAVGGRGTILGPVVTAFVLHVLFQGLDTPPGTRILFYAVTLMLMLRFFPGGVAGAVQRMREAGRRPLRKAGGPGAGPAGR
ncbi:MAG: branched-chain amino acid ABC transporter permease [Verrucomicrobiota bacterium]